MKNSQKSLWAILITCALATGIASTSWVEEQKFNIGLEEAQEILNEIEAKYMANPNSQLSKEEEAKLNLAVKTFESHEATHAYQLASALFFKALHLTAANRPDSVVVLLFNAKTKLGEAKNDLTFSRLGNIHTALSEYYDKFFFNFYFSSQHLDSAATYFEKIKGGASKVRIAETYWSQGFLFAGRVGFGRTGLHYFNKAKVKFHELSPEEQNSSDLGEGTFNFGFGTVYLAMFDSILQTGEPYISQQYADSAVYYLQKVKIGEKVDIGRYAYTQYALAKAYLSSKSPQSNDSAIICYKYCKELFALQGSGPHSLFGLACAGHAYALCKSGRMEEAESELKIAFKALKNPVSGIFDNTYVIETPSFHLLQALLIKAQLSNWVASNTTDIILKRKALSQTVYDIERTSGLLEIMKANTQERLSVEVLGNRMGHIHLLGIKSAALLYHLTNDNIYKSRAFNILEQNQSFILRTRLIKEADDSRGGYEMKQTTFRTIQKELPDSNTACISYSLTLDTTTIFVFTRDTAFFVLTNPIKSWKKNYNIHASYYSGSSIFQKEEANASQELYGTLLRDVTKLLPKEINKLLIMPNELLWNVRFDALITNSGENYRYLIEDYAIAYSYGYAVSNLMKKRVQERQEINTFNCAMANHHSAPLYEAGDIKFILKKIHHKFGGPNIAQNLFQREDFFNNIFEYSYVYLGAHARGAKNFSPEYASIRLVKDDVNMKNIYEYKANLSTVKTKILFMASCETAYGYHMRGEGMISIARALQYAGVAQVIAADAKVAPRYTAELAQILVGKDFSAMNDDAARILQKSKIEIIENNKSFRNAPKNWSQIRCIGY